MIGTTRREEILRTLTRAQSELRAQGVTHAALFGSVAKGEAGPESDIDIIIEIDPAAEVDLLGYVGIVQ